MLKGAFIRLTLSGRGIHRITIQMTCYFNGGRSESVSETLRWASGKAGIRNPESGIGTGIGTGTGTGTGIGTGMGRETYIKAGTTFTLI